MALSSKAQATDNPFPCLKCGSQLHYHPGSLTMCCNHCGSSHEIRTKESPVLETDYYQTLQQLENLKAHEGHDHHSAGNKHDEGQMQSAIKCHTCAAVFSYDQHVNAGNCPYCGSAVVAEPGDKQTLRPQALLPFSVSQEEAQNFYKSWLKSLWFAPNKLKRFTSQSQPLYGVYMPYWTYDCDAHSEYSGERGDVYYVQQRVRVQVNGKWRTQVRQVPKIRWSSAYGKVARHYDDTLVYASSSFPSSVAYELAPWDLHNLRTYQEEFVTGFHAEVYQLDLSQSFDTARTIIQPDIERNIRYDIGGDRQRIHKINTQYEQVKFKHILLPFWVAGFRFRGKQYQFIVNGRTGEVQGDRPYSVVKIASAVIAGLMVATALLYFAAPLMNTVGNSSFSQPSYIDTSILDRYYQ